MKKHVELLLLLTAGIILTGCGAITDKADDKGNTVIGSNNDTSASGDKDISENGDKTATEKFQAEVMEEGDFILVAPDQTSKEYKGSDKVSVNLTDCVVTDINGNKIAGKDLKAGDILEITYNGVMLESYPAQISASAVRVTGHNILIDAYLAVVDDIWQEDTGLNYGSDMIAVDTTGWIELSDLQKETVLSKLKNTYGAEIVKGTFDELEKQGLIDKEQLLFTKGVLIIISDMKYDKEKKQLIYSVQKWKAGDGAVGSDNCTATLTDNEWKINRGSMWIS